MLKRIIKTSIYWAVNALVLFGGSLVAMPDIRPLGPFGGDVRSLAVHPLRPQRVFLGTADGQLYVSENWGALWSKLKPGLNRRELVIDSLIFDPADPDILYAGGWELKSDRGALFRTTDGGKSWIRMDLGRFESSIRAVAVAPTDPSIIAVGINEGVLLSTDGGLKWNRITRGYRSLYKVHSLTFDPQDSHVLYVGTWRLAWKTTDLGKSWKPIHNGMFWDSDLFSIQIHPQKTSVIFAGTCSGIYRSLNGGGRWVKLKNGIPGRAKRTRAVRIDPAEPRIVYSGTTAGLYRSGDGGDSWKLILPDTVINAIIVNPADHRKIMIGTDDGGVLVSDDQGKGFRSANQGFILRQISSIAEDSVRLYASVSADGRHGGVFYSSDEGRTWQLFNEGLNLEKIRPGLILAKEEMVYLATNRGLFSGFPGKKKWSLIPSTVDLSINDLDFAGPGREKLLLAAQDGIYVLDIRTGRLRKRSIPVYDRAIYSVMTDDDYSYVGTDMGVFRSEDGGNSWIIKVEGLPYTAVLRIRKIGRRLFCGTASGVFYSDDRAESWQRGDGIFPIDIASIAGGPLKGQVFAADLNVGYLFESRDHGTSWQPIDLGASLSRISTLHLTRSGRLLAGTVAEGIVMIIPGAESPAGNTGSR